ncbi:hypothetical protein ACET79_13300, partial [Aeromonas veronii]|uniref:hypothetical protein n=1 Tax=Aeromonas veronii TaxID=654 RepID=UPI0038E0351D
YLAVNTGDHTPESRATTRPYEGMVEALNTIFAEINMQINQRSPCLIYELVCCLYEASCC